MMTYEVTTNGVYIGEFAYWEGERLWQGMSEEPGAVNIPESRLVDWQDLPIDDLPTALKAAKAAGFIDSYDMDLVEE